VLRAASCASTSWCGTKLTGSSLRGPLRRRQQREAERLPLGEPRMAGGARQAPDAQDVALALRHTDRTARVEHVEGVSRLDHEVVRGQQELARGVIVANEQALNLGLVVIEGLEVGIDVGFLEIVGRP